MKSSSSFAVCRFNIDTQMNEVFCYFDVIKVTCFWKGSAIKFALDLRIGSMLIEIVNDG